MTILVSVEFGQRMAQGSYLCIRGPSARHRIDPEEKPIAGMVHLFERTLLKCDLPAVPRADDTSIDDEIAAGALETCANGDSLSGLEKGFNQHAQPSGMGSGSFSGVSGGAVRSLCSVPHHPHLRLS